MARTADPTPLALLLLPSRLERLTPREPVDDLLRAPGVVAADPAVVSWGALGRLPLPVMFGLAAGQAKRLLRALRGTPRAVVIFDPVQAPLAFALLDRLEDPGADLWYGRLPGAAEPRGRRRGLLHELAEKRCALSFAVPEAGGPPAGEVNRPLLERLEALGIESGRLGSERLRPPG